MENAIFKYSDFFNNDGGFERVRAEFNKLSEDLIKKAKETREKTKLIDINNINQINSLEKETLELIEVNKKYQDSLKKIDAIELKLAESRKKNTSSTAKQTEALRKQRVEQRAIAKVQNTTIGTIENLRAKLSLVTIAWTKLTAKEIENTKRGQRLNESKKQLTTTLKSLEKATNDNRRNVGNYSSALGKARGSLVSLTSAMGISLGLFGAFRVIKSTISIVRDYEKANATLAGVLNKTKEDTIELREQSQLLGQTTVRTAQEVATTQTAYARLGFTLSEILALTPATIDGSIALNASLEDTALLVGAVVNSYDDLSATDAPQIIETLTAGTTKSALSFEKLATSLPIVLGGANALNIGLAEVTATLGKLADGGIDASSGATALRNIYIESAKRGINYKVALDQITKSQDKLTTANKLFGKRAAISALVIANNAKGVAELAVELENAKVVSQLVENELNTLDGSVKLLTSAWQGLVLKLNDATGSGNALSSSLRFLAENLETIFKVIGIATTTWVAYNLTVATSNALTKANIIWTKGQTIVQNIQTIATRIATVAQQAFNTAVKANPLGLLVALLASAVTAYYFFRDSVSDAEKAQKRFNQSRKEGLEQGNEALKLERKQLDEKTNLLKQEIALRKAKGGDDKKLDKEQRERQKDLLIEEIDRNQQLIDSGNKTLDILKKQTDDRIKNLEDNAKIFVNQKTGTAKVLTEDGRNLEDAKNREIQIYKDATGQIIGVNEARNKSISETNNELIKLDEQLSIDQAGITEKRLKELSLLRRRLEDLQNEGIKDAESREIKQTETKFKREISAIKGNSQVEKDLREQLRIAMNEDIDAIEGKYRLKRQQNYKDAEIFETSLIKDATEKRIAEEKARSAKILQLIKDSIVLTEAERAKFTQEETEKSTDAITKIQIEAELDRIDKVKLIKEAEVDQQKGFFDNDKDFEDFKAKELNKILLKNLKARLEALSKFQGDAFDVEKEQIKGQIAGLENIFSATSAEKLGDVIKEVFTQVFDEITKKQRQAVEESKKLLTDQEKAVESQRARAEAGLTNTLAFEQRELGKREAEVIKREKKEQRLQKIKSLYSSYNNYAGQGDKNPIVKALRDFAILEAITASFGDGGVVGVDGVKTNQYGITQGRSHKADGSGGVLAYHEGGEGFFSRKDIDAIGGQENFYKMKDLASSGKLDSNFFSKQKEMFVKGVPVGMTDPRLIEEMRSVKKAIESKPTQNWDVPGFADGVLDMVEIVVSKNKTIRNHYKTRKSRI